MAKKLLIVCLVCPAVFLATTGRTKCTGVHCRGYLPTIGPTPIRFALTPFYLEPNGSESVALSNMVVNFQKFSTGMNLPSSKIGKVGNTNSASSDAPWQAMMVMPAMGLRPLDETNANRYFVSSFSEGAAKKAWETASANDLLNVSPDMLINYFKSGHCPTNQANVSVLVPLEFIPPSSAKSGFSRATYQSP